MEKSASPAAVSVVTHSSPAPSGSLGVGTQADGLTAASHPTGDVNISKRLRGANGSPATTPDARSKMVATEPASGGDGKDGGEVAPVRAAPVQVVELDMMDKRKYYPLALLSGVGVRAMVYPLSLVKTRLQVQRRRAVYSGTFDAFRKITAQEGARGLYRGFWVNSCLILPQMIYITTYENVRQVLINRTAPDSPLRDGRVRAFFAGGAASIGSQTFVVPIDIVTQHVVTLGRASPASTVTSGATASTPKAPSAPSPTGGLSGLNSAAITSHAKELRFGLPAAVVSAVYKEFGLRGFWKGYGASLIIYVPSSAIWWPCYGLYAEMLGYATPDIVPRLALQCVSGMMAGFTASFLSNPLDAARARLQVKGRGTLGSTMSELWHQEGMRVFTKALGPRMFSGGVFSFCMALTYESIKRVALLEEHKDQVRW